MNRAVAAALALTLLSTATLQAQISFEVFGGTSFSLPTPLSISQEGEEDLDFTAHYSTKPFEPAPYYAARLAFWKGNRAWAVDLVHHKLYLNSPPPEVQFFKITYGFNMLTLSRVWRRGNFSYGVGAGPVITHPDNMVRGRRYQQNGIFGGSYRLSGGTLGAGANRRFHLTKDLFLSLDGRLSASYVRVPVVLGHADVPNVAIHLHGGAGYSF